MALTVATGIYQFFTQAEITAEVLKYKDAVKFRGSSMAASGGGQITSGTISGQTVSFSFPAGISSLEQWSAELSDAQAQLNDEPARSGWAIAGAGTLG